ncbi:hypothetical protein EBU24_03100 [bacterium]|nr:hypothetical protein [bacterium]
MKKLLILSFFTLTFNFFNTYALQEFVTQRRMLEAFSLAQEENKWTANQLKVFNNQTEKIKQRIEEEKKQVKQKQFNDELRSLGYNEEYIKFLKEEWGDMLPLGYPRVPLIHKPLNSAPLADTYTTAEIATVSYLNQPSQSTHTTESTTSSSAQSHSSYAGAHHIDASQKIIPTSAHKITKSKEDKQPEILNFAVKRWLITEEDRVFACEYCNATYARTGDLKKHHYICKISLTCNECSYNAGAQPGKLVEHLNNEHKIPYKESYSLVHDRLIKKEQEEREKKYQSK